MIKKLVHGHLARTFWSLTLNQVVQSEPNLSAIRGLKKKLYTPKGPRATFPFRKVDA